MPQLFKPSFREYLWGELVLNGAKHQFKYSIVDENTKAWYKPVKNLIGSTDNEVIATTYDLKFENGQLIYLNGVRHKIINCGKKKIDINETVMRMWKDDDSAYWIIEVK